MSNLYRYYWKLASHSVILSQTSLSQCIIITVIRTRVSIMTIILPSLCMYYYYVLHVLLLCITCYYMVLHITIPGLFFSSLSRLSLLEITCLSPKCKHTISLTCYICAHVYSFAQCVLLIVPSLCAFLWHRYYYYYYYTAYLIRVLSA